MKKSSGNSYERGYQTGFDIGYPIGRQQGISEYYEFFNGVSIIIPSCKDEERLRSSLESTFANYPELYEIIVVCQGSAGRAGRYLYSLQGKAKIKLLETSLGYAAAVNQGLRMARGDSLLIISEDAAVTDGLLSNVLAGRQVETNADDEQTSGFHMQISKNMFRKLGYWDESYDDQQAALEEYRQRVKKIGTSDHFSDFYPSHVIVKGCGETRYWIEDGFRHPIEQGEDLAAVRVSQLELKKWPIAPVITKDEFLQRAATISSVPSRYGPIAEGLLVRDGRGNIHQSLRGKLRRFDDARTLEDWGLSKRSFYAISDDALKLYPDGNPVAAPPVIRASNL